MSPKLPLLRLREGLWRATSHLRPLSEVLKRRGRKRNGGLCPRLPVARAGLSLVLDSASVGLSPQIDLCPHLARRKPQHSCGVPFFFLCHECSLLDHPFEEYQLLLKRVGKQKKDTGGCGSHTKRRCLWWRGGSPGGE